MKEMLLESSVYVLTVSYILVHSPLSIATLASDSFR